MIKLKKLLPMIVVATMIGGVMTGCSNSGSNNADTKKSESTDGSKSESNSNILIGSAIYKFDDTFMTGVRTAMEKQSDAEGVKIELVDSQNKQPTQNEQVDTFITKGVNALAVNAVDRTAAGPIIEKAKAKDLPIVFLNREPEEADMQGYDKVWYVGAKAEQSGTQSGEIIVDYFKENPEADKNGDGVIQYVMLQGEPGHQDATLRTEYSIKAIEDGGFKAEKLAADTAMWDKAKATDLMKAFITGQGLDKIEAVLCNNDDMALGAIEALKAEGYNKGDASKYIPVVGVDATAPALQAMKDGSLLGTVLNDAENQGKATVNVAIAAAQGKEINKDTVGYEVTDSKYIWIDYVKITQDNYQDYLK
ncbi:MAG: galactose ABC transporter substrate-binding protein [Clostridium celatum]|nr:galactose/glucose ABC transporter substrate-binding protein MglB [Clostridium celatum]MDU2123027.1 galactose ABC transporter substrate-binding protein [Clostridium celatum]MDU4979116.1 galactose ABC transporter substrate-binding protein [Clostridium celatum]